MSLTRAVLYFALVLAIQSIVIFALGIDTITSVLIGIIVGIAYGLWAGPKIARG
jgi:hypothetical protein